MKNDATRRKQISASAHAITGRPPRLFISYQRRAQEDSRLALVLVDLLRRAGCEVFIDQEMEIGTDWSAEIDRRIAWCDYLVVLISEDSVSSEMVQDEVRRAHNASMSERRSKIIPIRVAYTGPLGYELDSYLGKLQCALWQSAVDDGTIVVKVLQAAKGQAGIQDTPVAPLGQHAKDANCPEPKVDMRLIRESVDVPGSPLSSDNPFYVTSDADRRIAEFAVGKARTVVIKGPNERDTMSDIFISYKREEQREARKLANALEREGWTVWWDPKLRAGDNFDKIIEAGLNESKCVIVLWSQRSVTSDYVVAEASEGMEQRKLVPVAIENVTLPFRFKRLHTPQLLNWDGSSESAEFRKLVEDIRAKIGEPARETGKQ